MKHFIMLLCGVVLPFFASAQEFAFQGLKFKVTDATKKTCQLAGFEAGEIAALSIPSVATNGGVDYTVTSIADQAFFYSGIRSLTIPNTVLSIGEFAFCWCTSLSEVNFGESVETIGENAFNTCSSLKTISLPNSLKKLGEGVFSACKLLTTVSLPASVVEIGINIFGESPNLSEINVAEGNTVYASADGVLFKADFSELIQYPCGNARTEYTVPEGVKTIDAFAIGNCANLKKLTLASTVKTLEEGAVYTCETLESLTLNEGLEKIGNYAFASATSLESVVIPSTVVTVAEGAFMSAENLSNITIGAGVETIGKFAFYGCAPEEIVLPAKLKSIDMYAFDIPTLATLKVKNLVPPVCTSGAFSTSVQQKAHLTVPEGSLEAYKAAAVWKDFANIAEGDVSGINGVIAADTVVSVNDGDICISGPADKVEVYNAAGACVYNGTASRISGLPHGIYMVCVGGSTVKVAL